MMKEQTDATNVNHSALSASRVEETRRWPVRIVGLFLFAQGAGSLLVSFRLSLETGWAKQIADDFLSRHVLGGVSSAGLFVLIATLAFGAAIGLIAMRREAWLVAMTTQALTLGTALWYHFHDGPDHIYLLMAYSVAMVFYINSRPVRVVLHGLSYRESTDA